MSRELDEIVDEVDQIGTKALITIEIEKRILSDEEKTALELFLEVGLRLAVQTYLGQAVTVCADVVDDEVPA